MNRSFNVQSSALRTVFASAALVATLTVAASIDLLSRHYGAETQAAAAEAHVVAVASNSR